MKRSRIIQALVLLALFAVSCYLFSSGSSDAATDQGVEQVP